MASQQVSLIEGIPVQKIDNPAQLFEAVLAEIRKPGQSVIHYLNIHVANTALHNRKLREALLAASLVYCDGAGIVLGSRWLGNPLPARLTAADWFVDLIRYLSGHGCGIYLLGGEPGVPEAAIRVIESQVPQHTIVGSHHGFILNSPQLEERVIAEINRLSPGILIMGFGTPLQECWVAENRHRLNVPAIYPLGAVMDFVSKKARRCPAWMGDHGLEWLYRLMIEPHRLMGRYLIGNPWFMGRIASRAFAQAALSRGGRFFRGTLRVTGKRPKA